MGVLAPAPQSRLEKTQTFELPVIDLSCQSEAPEQVVAACEAYGFFKVINHRVPRETISLAEEQSLRFFNKPSSEKHKAGPANPLGYGSKNIGFAGDTGEVEYLLLGANPNSFDISQRAKNIFDDDPEKFSSSMSSYIAAVRDLACEILDMMAKGLSIANTSAFSEMVRAADGDSVLRLNYYPKTGAGEPQSSMHSTEKRKQGTSSVGFGEHSDPQILTLLRSNGVDGLEISPEDGTWIPVPADPSAFWVNVGDTLQAMTNGRLKSVRHRVLTNQHEPRMSTAYFATPPLHARITCPPELITPQRPPLYRPFTWAEYKSTAYSLCLGDTRLNLFRAG